MKWVRLIKGNSGDLLSIGPVMEQADENYSKTQCSQCRELIPTGSKFCNKCGNIVSLPDISINEGAAVKQQTATAETDCAPVDNSVESQIAPVSPAEGIFGRIQDQSSAELSGMKACPFCAEDIKAAAIFCKHCRNSLTGELEKKISFPIAVTAPTLKPAPIQAPAPVLNAVDVPAQVSVAAPLTITDSSSPPHKTPDVIDVVRLQEDLQMSKKSAGVAYFLYWFFGIFGAHKFYMGYQGQGILYLFCLLTCLLILPALFLAFCLFVDLFTIPGQVEERNRGQSRSILESFNLQHMTGDTRDRIAKNRGEKSLSIREMQIWYGTLTVLILLAGFTGVNHYFATFMSTVSILAFFPALGALFIMPKQFRSHLFVALIILIGVGGVSGANIKPLNSNTETQPLETTKLESSPKVIKSSSSPKETKRKVDYDNDSKAIALAKTVENCAMIESSGKQYQVTPNQNNSLVQKFGKFYSDYAPFKVYGVSASSDIDSRFEVAGTVFNTSPKAIPYVQVEVEFLDAHGKSCGQTITNTINLASQGNWKFRVVKYSEDARKYVIRRVFGREAVPKAKEIAYIHSGSCFGFDSVESCKQFGTFRVVDDDKYEEELKSMVPHNFYLDAGTQVEVIRSQNEPPLSLVHINEGDVSGKDLFVYTSSLVRQPIKNQKELNPKVHSTIGSANGFRVGQVVELTGSTHLFLSEERWMDEKSGDWERALSGSDPNLLWMNEGTRFQLLECRDPIWKAKIIRPYLSQNDIWWVRKVWLREIPQPIQSI